MYIVNGLVAVAGPLPQLGQGPGQLYHVVGHKADDEHRQNRADHPQSPALDLSIALLLLHRLGEQRADDDQVAEEDEEKDDEEAEHDADVDDEDGLAAFLVMLKAASDGA